MNIVYFAVPPYPTSLFIFFSPLGNDCVYATVVLLLLDIIVTADVSLC